MNTGAVQVDGGVGIAKNLSVGGDFDVDGATTLDDTNIEGTLTVDGSISVTGTSQITATTFSGTATKSQTVQTRGTNADQNFVITFVDSDNTCLLYTSPSPRDKRQSRMPSSA